MAHSGLESTVDARTSIGSASARNPEPAALAGAWTGYAILTVLPKGDTPSSEGD